MVGSITSKPDRKRLFDPEVLLTPSFYFFLTSDVFILLILFLNRDKECDVPLYTWLVVGLLLSFPSSYLTYIINNAYGTKSGLLAEVVLLIVSFFWMAVGTIEVSMSTTCQNTNPGVWWVSFVSINIFWCVVVGFIISCIVITLGIMFFQGGRNPEFNIE
ncbi:putative integral membrane protein [Theileria parva strain Muguga]|uniref:putative integral membrane protein n=1 Tax=Theileria parva strain Muguga TaxID=333668 RepID=UPI001C618D58|nr:putative integral membrane protein [Theileria parva strain Muguga]EAN33010.2 putative integral membrane protein [Theileria parva strain Muguga]